MDKKLTNILQIPLTFEPGQNLIDYTISTRDFNQQYMVINPKVSTFMSWLNISEEIGNNKIKISNGDSFTQTTEDAVKIALKTKKSYYNYDDPENGNQTNVNCFNQGILVNPQLNCFTNNSLVWSQSENYYYNPDGSFKSIFFDPQNFENGSGVGGVNAYDGSTTRIRQIKNYTINGNFAFNLQRDISNLNIAFYIYFIYDGQGTYLPALSVASWTPINTTSQNLILKTNIPFNQNYQIRFFFKSFDDNNLIDPSSLNTLVKRDIIDISDSNKWIFSEPIPCKKDTFYIPFNNFLVNYVFNLYKYDINGDYLGAQQFANPASGVQINTPGCRYVILAIFSNTQFNLTYNGSTQPNFPTTSGITNRTTANNWIEGINFFASAPIISDIITIPDGYYSGIVSTASQTGYSYIMDLFNNNTVFQSFNGLLELNQLNFKTRFSGQLFIEFLGTSNRLFGFYNTNELFVDITPVTSSDPIDLFSDGRFSQINLVLSNLASQGYVNESNSLITIASSSNYGSLIKETDISYKKLLPRTANLNTLSIRITDGFYMPIKLNDRLFLRFEILCYSD